MKIVRYLLPSAAAGMAALMLAPTPTHAWQELGFSLGLSYRSARVFNNFTAPSANDNQTPDPNWPGALGATLAIWKGCAEWNSTLHNLNGNGDPHQPGGLGSGGANFDISWQGAANGIGGLGDMIHSEISGSQGGVLAYTEGPSGGPGSTGWRIRYYSAWTWADGPSSALPGGQMDLQGVACHEHGHALGLGHTTVPGSTMLAAVTGNAVAQRSIESDDIGGVQSIYGVEDTAVKPKLLSLSGNGPAIVITGQNFAASSNEVWFTQAAPATSTAAVKVTGLSSNGTSIAVNVPAGVGPGEIQVKKGGVSSAKGLSNGLSIVPNWGGGCNGNVTNYCTPSITTNICTPYMTATGTPSATTGFGFLLTGNVVEGQKTGLVFYGISGRHGVLWGPNSASYLCVKSPVQRTPTRNSGGTVNGCNGSITIDWNAYIASNPNALGQPFSPGQVVDAQCWFRDPPAPKTTNLSDGIEFTVCP